MNILILGSGGREHALAWKIAQSPLCSKLYVAPGNAGTLAVAENADIDILNFEVVSKFCLQQKIELIFVGPETPLVLGIVDYFSNSIDLKNILIIGPNKKAAQLEGSKDFSKQFMAKYKIPTAASKTFIKSTIQEGLKYLENHTLPVVLKADGLAAGKGVIIAKSTEEAKETILAILEQDKFGDAGAKVVIEEFLDGIELSAFIITDGNNYVMLPEAKDYKRIGEGDTGLNTGGMGAVSPVPFADEKFLNLIEKTIIQPTVEGLKIENIDYNGIIFFGIMNVSGNPYLIEYNARLGDPETEVIIPRIESDIVELLVATAQKKLLGKKIQISSNTATTVMLVAGGYPEAYEKNLIISGLDNVVDVLVFHAGTKVLGNNVVTNGGRVISITSLDNNIENALAKSNRAAENIIWKNKYYRKDIGLDLLMHKNKF